MSTILSGKEKQLLESRYEDLEFVEEIADDLKCGRCRRLTIHHYFSQCGHVFCANCQRLLTDDPSHCPCCHAPIHNLAEQKVMFEQRINAVKVMCPNKKYGCPVTTTLLLLPEHLCQCKDTQEASLPAELTLNEVTKSMLNRFEEMSKLMNHVVNKIDQLEQKVSHLDIVEMSLEDVKGQIGPIKMKISEQPIDKILGQMREMKSEMKDLRNKVEGHEQSLRVSKDEEALMDGDDALYNFFYCHKYEPTVLESVAYKWTLKDVTQLTKKKTFEFESDTFSLTGYPFAAKAKLMLKKDDGVYIFICFKNSSGPKWWSWGSNEVIPSLTCILKDIKNQQEMKHRIRKNNYLFNSSLQYDTYYYNNILSHKSWLTHSNYYADDDSVEILILVEPPSVAFRMMSTDGSIIQRISHYKHRLQLAQEGHYKYHCSPYFSTKFNGYRVMVKVWMNGHGDFKGKGLTAEILFLCGKYDLELAKSFKHTTTVMLMNQRDLSSRLIQSAEEDIGVKKSYYINMATHKEIQDSGYIINDSLIYQINIQPI